MTYLQFLLIFLLPPLLLLGRATGHRRGALAGDLQPDDRLTRRCVALLPLVALLYTTPWDNYLVWRGVWGYPADQVLARLGVVPVEEYLFFVLHSLLGGLWVLWLLRRRWPPGATPGATARWWGAGTWLALAVVGGTLLLSAHGVYLGLILVWAAPVLALQWAFGGDLLGGLTRVRLAAIVPLTLYLALADRLALGLDIWQIDPRATTGWQLAGLPIEEALFFLIASVMVVEGLLLFIHPGSWTRVQALWTRLHAPVTKDHP